MSLSISAIAGIVVVAVAIITSIFGAVLWINRRHRRGIPTTKTTPASSPIASNSRMPRSRLTGGHRKRAQDTHGRYPSLENGPGPTIVKKIRKPTSLHSRGFHKSDSSACDAPDTPNKLTLSSLTTVEEPARTATKDTATEVMSIAATDSTGPTALNTEQLNRPSSLHQAVLDICGQGTEIGGEHTRVDSGRAIKAEDRSSGTGTEVHVRPKGYTGSWP
ncbi:hypothetical protein ACJQWK_00640 [Exserohilum turcicum]|uniref:Uncharacterized protein n=1 Tax=Exserohilum turcicum (strain 28A) TaxID=671987 RepID=R0IFB5_EXST2|nr:uncharacterized protein SETTUDRAFT_32787 [Exserohilum turcica Et28A]EOA83756.1 hypothetical protein SETTUDRAFT_32787 [Exserohilum turcica Et28A]